MDSMCKMNLESVGQVHGNSHYSSGHHSDHWPPTISSCFIDPISAHQNERSNFFCFFLWKRVQKKRKIATQLSSYLKQVPISARCFAGSSFFVKKPLLQLSTSCLRDRRSQRTQRILPNCWQNYGFKVLLFFWTRQTSRTFDTQICPLESLLHVEDDFVALCARIVLIKNFSELRLFI